MVVIQILVSRGFSAKYSIRCTSSKYFLKEMNYTASNIIGTELTRKCYLYNTLHAPNIML